MKQKKKKVEQATAITENSLALTKPNPVAPPVTLEFHAVSEASSPITTTRRNIAGNIERTERFQNIDDGLMPFRNSTSIYGSNKSSVDVRDAVILCQKCYYNFSIFRNIIDLMTEFSITDICWKGGNKQSREFFKSFWDKNIWNIQDQFYREWYRSGNVFFYRFDAQVTREDVKKFTQVYAQEYLTETPDNMVNIPARYLLLNPADVHMLSSLDFADGFYVKTLTEFELMRLRKPQTPEDEAVLKNLPAETQKYIAEGARVVYIPLEPDRVSILFYKKQDYEPFAVPMGYPVLEDINFKAEMRKIDMAISRTMQQIILLVTTGTEPEKGGINQKHLDALRKLFQNQSVGRVLVADWTTEAQFVIPDIGNLLDPKKYEVVNDDINTGLNNVFMGGEKFANQQQKVEIFIARLQHGRKAFLNNFLIPETKRIAKELNFKNFPLPYYEDIELKDNTNYAKLYAHLIEIGVLTPEQGFKAIETNVLPDPAILEEEQTVYKEQRDKGLYEPLLAKPAAGEGGRPLGSKAPQTVKTINPIGASEKYSTVKVTKNMLLAQNLNDGVVDALKKQYNIKRLTKLQKEISNELVTQIISNEEPDKWLSSIATYCASPDDRNHDRVREVNRIAIEHQLDNYLAGILLASKVDNEPTV